MKPDNLNIAIQYSEDVLAGVIPACNYLKQACTRFINDLKHYEYDADEVDSIISFVNQLDLTEQVSEKKFILEPWQTFFVCNVYGLIKSDNTPKYRSTYTELSRKNGKSQLMVALAIYQLIFKKDSQIILSANSREQAKNILFKKAKQFSTQLDQDQKHLKQYYNKIIFGISELLVTASEANKLDGLNPNFICLDEFHEAQDNKLFNVLKSSQGSREDGQMHVITTAGFDVNSFCYSIRSYGVEILSGEKVDESMFVLIFTLDSGDDYQDKRNWIKSNPNLGVSIFNNFLESEVTKAVNNSAERAGVLVKNFNVWLKSNVLEEWLGEDVINAALHNISMQDPMFKDVECYCGVDLASVSDITAITFMFQLDEKLYFFNEYFICEDSKNSNVNKEIYKEAEKRGELNITSGNVTDYDVILQRILEVNQSNPIISLSYDRWNSTQFIINATEAGLFCEAFSQTAGSLNMPLKEFERLIKSDHIVMQKNSITKWMLNNAIIKVNHMGNYSLDKSSKQHKIDGVASAMNAIGTYLKNPVSKFNVW